MKFKTKPSAMQRPVKKKSAILPYLPRSFSTRRKKTPPRNKRLRKKSLRLSPRSSSSLLMLMRTRTVK